MGHMRHLTVSFSIYDVDSDGHVTKDELFQLLDASLMQAEVDLPEEAVRGLVNATFEEADVDKDNKISFEEYKAMVLKHPEMLSAVTISTPID
jgi:serine/threonine-protein phosphatase 2B regulatory subunit